MRKFDSLVIATKIKGANALDTVKNAVSTKKDGDETLLVKIMLMVIAVFLVVIFRNTLKDIITTLLSQVSTKIQGMYETTTP